jgi:hypothetical protein
MRVAMDGKALGFPTADGAFAVAEIGGNLLPGVQTLLRRTIGGGFPEGGDFITHAISVRGSGADSIA